MKLLLSFILSLWLTPSLNAQHLVNKTKRTLANEGGGFGDPNTFWLYTDNFKSPVTPRSPENVFASSKPLAIVELQPVKIVDPPKEIPQSAIYDIQQQQQQQQDPTNLVPNVKQVYPTGFDFTQEIQQYRPQLFQNPGPNIATSETIVSPVHHSHIVRNHNHYSTGPRAHPLYNLQPTYHIPKKYAYVNGKIIYDPNAFQIQQNHFQPPPPPNYLHSAQTFQPQHLQKQQLINYHNRHFPRPNLTPPAIQHLPQIQTGLPGITKFQPPKMQFIDTPSQPLPQKDKPQQSRKKDNRDEEKPVNEKEETEDDSEENAPYHDDEYEPYEDDDSSFSEKYSFDEEESDRLSSREEEDGDEDDDTNRGSSRTRYVKTKKYPKKKYKQGKKSELYYSGKYEYPDKHNPKKNTKRQKMHYKGYKLYKNVDDPDAGFSENVPVVHKQKLLKEKWFVSKSLSDRKRFDD